jgi:hypothetical protein
VLERAARSPFYSQLARIIAQRVVDSVYPSKHASQKIQNRNSEQDKAESSDDSDFDEEPDEFAELETFITGSAAFCKLRDNIRAFLGLEPSQEHAVLDASSCKLLGNCLSLEKTMFIPSMNPCATKNVHLPTCGTYGKCQASARRFETSFFQSHLSRRVCQE